MNQQTQQNTIVQECVAAQMGNGLHSAAVELLCLPCELGPQPNFTLTLLSLIREEETVPSSEGVWNLEINEFYL